MIAGSGADVAIVMEAAPVRPFLGELEAIYPFRAGCSDDATCDLMLLSRLPLEDIRIGSLSSHSPNRVMRASVSVDGTKLTIVPVHLTKPYFDDAAAFEIDNLIRELHNVPGPLVVAGDFNAAAWSNNVRRLIDRAGLVVGPDYPATWPPQLGYLAVPIDNIFTRSSALIEQLTAIPETYGSNHRALLASIVLLSEQ
jgi:endonuclease/exonuclease/phosphatase (EEP) superfamily protein YafD